MAILPICKKKKKKKLSREGDFPYIITLMYEWPSWNNVMCALQIDGQIPSKVHASRREVLF